MYLYYLGFLTTSFLYTQYQAFGIYGGLINNVRRAEGPQKALNFGDHNSENLITELGKRNSLN